MTSRQRPARDAAAASMAGLVAAAASAFGGGLTHATAPMTMCVATVVGSAPAVLSSGGLLRRHPRTSTPADQVTLARAVLASGCAAFTVLVVAGAVPAQSWWLVALTVPTLLLDAVDGYVARRTGSASAAGARFDMEVDAGVLVVVSVAVSSFVGWWVLLIGAMRYLFIGASWLRPTLRTTLPRSQFRRAVAAFQGAALAVAIAPVMPSRAATLVVLLALVLLLTSFLSEIAIKERRARSSKVA